jgi:hypothetical protein
MISNNLKANLGMPVWIRFVCECAARGLQEDSIIKLLMSDFAMDRQLAKTLFAFSLRHLRIEGLDREQERGLALARLTFLYRSLVEREDFKGAHAVEQTRIGLLRLHEVAPTSRFADPEEREKSFALQEATEQKGEELQEVLKTLTTQLQAFKEQLEAAKAERPRRRRAAGGQGGRSAGRDAEKGQEGANGDGNQV